MNLGAPSAAVSVGTRRGHAVHAVETCTALFSGPPRLSYSACVAGGHANKVFSSPSAECRRTDATSSSSVPWNLGLSGSLAAMKIEQTADGATFGCLLAGP
jgi:hypothetical protein